MRIAIFVITSLLMVIALPKTIHAQVKFNPITLTKAIEKAATTDKIVMVQYAADEHCKTCNEVAGLAFKDAPLGKYVSEKCIAIYIDKSHTERESFIDAYNQRNYSGTFFIAPNAALIHFYPGTISSAASYKKEIDVAYANKGKYQSTLNALEAKWKNNEADFEVMEETIQRRNDLYLNSDSLLNIYFYKLPKDSLLSKRVIAFIFNQSPIINSAPFDISLSKNLPFNEVWNSFSFEKRAIINQTIIYKSLQRAIQTKNEKFAQRVAKFAQSTHSKNSVLGFKAYDKQMLRYYIGINDTSKYIKAALAYYNTYLMPINVDSLNNAAKQSVTKSTTNNTSLTPIQYAIRYSNELNEGAAFISKITTDSTLLATAKQWAKKSIALQITYYNMRTYASICYILKQYQEAIAWQQKAIKAKKEEGFSTKDYQDELEEMLKRK